MGAFFSKLCCCSRSRSKKEKEFKTGSQKITDRSRTNSNLIIQRSQLICDKEFEFSVYSKELERDFEIKNRRWEFPFSNSNYSYGSSSWNSKSFEGNNENNNNNNVNDNVNVNVNNIAEILEYPRKVFLVRHKESGQRFNLTRIKKRNLNKLSAERICKEIGLIISCLPHHDLLINLYWTWQDVRYLYRVDEAVCENGIEVVNNLKEFEGLAVDLAIALHYLHGCGLVHGNVNPSAIFRSIETTKNSNNKNCLRLGSFGYLRSLEGGKRLKGISGDYEEFRAPECNDGNGEYFEEIDWFSYGKVLKFWREQFKIENTDLKSINKEKIKELDDLIIKLTFVNNVDERLGYGPGGFKAIQSHSFFSSTSWSDHLNLSNPESSAKKRNSRSLNASIESLKRINSIRDDIFIIEREDVDFSKFLEFTWDEKGEMGIMLESIIKRSF